MNRHFRQHLCPAAIISAGLLASQLFFALFVYHSNLALLSRLQCIASQGYLPVPGSRVMAGLDALPPAFWGAVFYTLTAGAALVLGVLLLVCLWYHLAGSRPLLLLPFLILWEIAILQCIRTQYPVFLTAVFLIVPAFVGIFTLQWLKQAKKKAPAKMLGFHAIIFGLLVCIWLPNAHSGIFTNIRDQLFWSNPAGQAVSNFYYRYTLYPAEAFKALHQKQIKTSRIEAGDPELAGRLRKPLLRLDYLPVPAKPEAVDLLVRQSGGNLVLAGRKGPALRTSADRFLAAPERVLKKFSQKTDQMAFLRGFCRISLVTAAPLLLYLTVFQGLVLVFRSVPGLGFPKAAAALTCLFLAAGSALPLYGPGPAEKTAADNRRIQALLHSQDPAGQLKAARRIARGEAAAGPSREALYRLAQSPRSELRYWAARALGGAKSRQSFQMLIQLLEDPHPNVVCAALHALGRQGRKAAVAPIRRLMLSSGNWYVQLYAYNALKEIGWIQDPGRASG